MTRWIKTGLLFSLFIATMAHFSACGTGGGDAPFVFGGESGGGQPSGSPTPGPGGGGGGCNPACPAGQVCQDGACVSPPDGGCDSNDDCQAGEVCDATTHQCRTATCTDDPGKCSATQKCEGGVCVCDPVKTTCVAPPGACEVLFDAAMTLKIDDWKTATGHYDSPSTCCEYGGINGTADCPGSPPVGNFLQAPSENTDLYCCAPGQTGPILGHPELFCDPEWRHQPVPEVAATRWPAFPLGSKIHMKFDLSNGCKVWLLRDQFPEYHLDGSALDASIAIDAGKNYTNFPGSLPQSLNEEEIEGQCEKSTDASGNLQINITSLPLRFAVQLYSSFTQCVTGVKTPGDTPNPVPPSECPPSFTPDTLYYPTDNPATPDVDERRQSYQIIPGFDRVALPLTTGERTQPPVDPTRQSAMTITGSPLHYDASGGGVTRMSLVAAFDMPDGGISTSRDDHTGVGQLHAQLNKALLTAEIIGTVQKLNGTPIQTEADLTDCEGGGPPGGTQGLHLSMSSTFGASQESLTVSGDPTHPTDPFTAEACVPGTHQGGECQFAADLPFVKDAAAGDPLSGLEAKFIKEGTISIQNSGGPTDASMTLQVPETAGNFRILNADALQNITLAPGNSTTLNVRFEPAINAGECSAASDVVNREENLSISTSHSVTITLKGRAKCPAAELRMEELATAAPFGMLTAVLPANPVLGIDYGETTLGAQTRTKLYRILNTGVRALAINNVQVQDVNRNFRLGSVYQGVDFEHREWAIGNGHPPWTVQPNGSSDFFFFLNYGPLGKISGGVGSTREDSGFLALNTAQGNYNLTLTGTAKKDTRATLSLLIQDETRFTVSSSANPAHQPDLVVGSPPTVEHLYRASNQLFSYRQDPETRRTVYVVNSGTGAGIDELVIQRVQFTPDAANKFVFTQNADDPRVEACLTAAEDSTAPCATLSSTGDANRIKLGTIVFTPAGGSYFVADGLLVVKSTSKATGALPGAEGIPPIIGGNPTTANGNFEVIFHTKGASGAPGGGGDLDLKVHRLMAGFSNRINEGLQRSLIVSTATKGIVSRIGNPSYPLDTWKEVYTIPNGINLNPVTGVATLQRIVVPVDSNMNSPATPGTLAGLRLFNSPGSLSSHQEGGSPAKAEYFVQCGGASLHNCSFFYLYIGDWAGSTTPMPSSGPTPAACQGKYPVRPLYNGATPAAMAAQFSTVLRPDDPTQYGCLTGADGIRDETSGTYDPVTGEIGFDDLAVRLYAPRVPEVGNTDIDATLRVSLTTGCVTQDEVPDPASKSAYLVPNATLNDDDYNMVVMPANPLLPYVDVAGLSCVARELHGRPMFGTDTNAMTATLDNDSDSDALNFNGFDLAGVGRNTASSTSVSGANMYIVIKAEVGDF